MLKCEVMQLHSNANIAVPLSVAWAFEVPSDTSLVQPLTVHQLQGLPSLAY